MGLPRTFVGFSSTDIKCYWLMLAWKENENVDFDFTDCQLQDEVDSENEAYIKSKIRNRIGMAAKFALLIGEDTRYKYKYVRWEAEVAIEKGCTIIGVNLDGSRGAGQRACPPVIYGIGAIFVPFSPQIVAYALEHYTMHDGGNYHYKDEVYRHLGYQL
ncbi:MAG TPA: TIR domain-containing protein [Verrucomicrobiae bacterium]|nr:TIR domain-containing protein [Verrucomicrobiae bacterium]